MLSAKDAFQACVRFVDAHSQRIVACLIVIAFAAGGVYSSMRGSELPYIDEVDYQRIAENLVRSGFYSNDGIEPNADRAPVLPLAMAGLMAIGAGVPEWRLMNFGFYCLTLWLLYLLVCRQRQAVGSLARFAGGLAVILALSYVVLFYSASTLFPQTLGACLFVLVLLLLPNAANSFWRWSCAGALFGLLLLTIPMFLFTLPVILLWIVIRYGLKGIAPSAALLVCCMAVVSVWTVRNYLVFDMFIPLTSSSGAALLWGNAPEATIGGAEVEYLQRAYEQSGELNQAQADKFRMKLAIEQIRDRKLAVLGFYCVKVLNHFSFVNDHYAKSEVAIWKTLIMACTYLPLLALFLLRLVLWKRYPPSDFELLLIVIYISTAFAYAIFHTRIRYRLPYDYALIVIDALFITEWLSRSHLRGEGAARQLRAED